jgi:hypothetical protein
MCFVRRNLEDAMPIPRVLLVDRQWGELVQVIEFISSRLDEIGVEHNLIQPDSEKYAEQDPVHGDDWDQGYLTALNDMVCFIQRLHSKSAA